MADQPPFDDGDEPQVPPTEGVRIIKPDEAAEAVERGDAVRRRSDRPKYGDRPEAPDGPRPDLRFPLAESADPTLIVRPKVAPVDSMRSTDPLPEDARLRLGTMRFRPPLTYTNHHTQTAALPKNTEDRFHLATT
jgi:hypothetical protein